MYFFIHIHLFCLKMEGPMRVGQHHPKWAPVSPQPMREMLLPVLLLLPGQGVKALGG